MLIKFPTYREAVNALLDGEAAKRPLFMGQFEVTALWRPDAERKAELVELFMGCPEVVAARAGSTDAEGYHHVSQVSTGERYLGVIYSIFCEDDDDTGGEALHIFVYTYPEDAA